MLGTGGVGGGGWTGPLLGKVKGVPSSVEGLKPMREIPRGWGPPTHQPGSPRRVGWSTLTQGGGGTELGPVGPRFGDGTMTTADFLRPVSNWRDRMHFLPAPTLLGTVVPDQGKFTLSLGYWAMSGNMGAAGI